MPKVKTIQADIASYVRRFLKKQYPVYKFRVTSRNYSVRVTSYDVPPTVAKSVKQNLKIYYQTSVRVHKDFPTIAYLNFMSFTMRETLRKFIESKGHKPHKNAALNNQKVLAVFNGDDVGLSNQFWGE